MAKGNEIVVSTLRRGLEGWAYMKAGQTCKPGYILEMDLTAGESNGLFTVRLANPDADGGRPKGPEPPPNSNGLIRRSGQLAGASTSIRNSASSARRTGAPSAEASARFCGAKGSTHRCWSAGATNAMPSRRRISSRSADPRPRP